MFYNRNKSPLDMMWDELAEIAGYFFGLFLIALIAAIPIGLQMLFIGVLLMIYGPTVITQRISDQLVGFAERAGYYPRSDGFFYFIAQIIVSVGIIIDVFIVGAIGVFTLLFVGSLFYAL